MHAWLRWTDTDRQLSKIKNTQQQLNINHFLIRFALKKNQTNKQARPKIKIGLEMMLIYLLSVFSLSICILLGSMMLSETCWKSNYLSALPMQWGGLLSLKDTEINIWAPEETFPVMEATNLSRAFALMLAFTVTFTLIAYQEILTLLVLTRSPKKVKEKPVKISIIRAG